MHQVTARADSPGSFSSPRQEHRRAAIPSCASSLTSLAAVITSLIARACTRGGEVAIYTCSSGRYAYVHTSTLAGNLYYERRHYLRNRLWLIHAVSNPTTPVLEPLVHHPFSRICQGKRETHKEREKKTYRDPSRDLR